MMTKAIYRRDYVTVVIHFNRYSGESESLDIVGEIGDVELDEVIEANGKPLEGWTVETF